MTILDNALTYVDGLIDRRLAGIKTYVRNTILSIYAAVHNPSYDIPWIAGYNNTLDGEDLAIQSYGLVLIPRSIEIQELSAKLGTASVGADVVFDVLKNGTSIWTTKPKFIDGSTVLTPGVLTSTVISCVAGDILEFKVIQVGTTTKGQKLAISLKGREL